MRFPLSIILCLAVFLTACAGVPLDLGENTVVDQPTPPEITEPTPAPTEPFEESEDADASEAQPEGAADLTPQSVTFAAADGRTLEGLFYPPKTDGAPIVVLLHWAPGSMADWADLARWLQNGDGSSHAFLPALADDATFGALAFNFGGYGASQGNRSRDQLYSDALAAFDFAATLPGIDPQRILGIGASIGADGAIDGCAWLFAQDTPGGSCVGALSLSPGGYLGYGYADAAAYTRAQANDIVLYCVAAQNDAESAPACASAGANVMVVNEAGADHGMDLLNTSHPEVLDTLIDFLQATFDIPIR